MAYRTYLLLYRLATGITIFPEKGTFKMYKPNGFIDPHGGFRSLKSYQMSEIVYDATVKFCDRWIGCRSRTHDQMVQAARSGKQNIAEGSMASGTPKKIELKLVGIARASLEELLLDYHDFFSATGAAIFKAGRLHREVVPCQV